MRSDCRRAQLRVLGLERPANERGEAFGFVLLRAQPLEVLDAIFGPLDVTEHHGCG